MRVTDADSPESDAAAMRANENESLVVNDDDDDEQGESQEQKRRNHDHDGGRPAQSLAAHPRAQRAARTQPVHRRCIAIPGEHTQGTVFIVVHRPRP
jgi:hypothetical protein